ncbi:hypothetical protein [Bacillus norwichensis]|uniref:Uncharacterized protein n=1 Tax=Bacillus norwichensis TaxID=2762217 RepID=A0ABR8VGQ2_9BACI|nr:hypothetical protein [Bacillus norwichensis]MBD8003776.1 hypothetical protein [Bacillus norwichensis]
MHINKIFEAFSEFQAILSQVGENAIINETLDVTEIKIEKNISLHLLKELSADSDMFEVLCNPFSDGCDDIIHYLEQGTTDISEIESISILLEKNTAFEEMGNLNCLFFDIYRSLGDLTISFFSILILVFLLFSFIYYYLMSNSSKKRFQITEKQFLYFINEISLMQKEEIDELKQTYLEEPYHELCNTLNKLLWLLVIINVLLFISFLVFACIKGYFCFC